MKERSFLSALTVFLVIQWKGDIYDIQGIFSSRMGAINACKTDQYCFAKFEINEELPAETVREGKWTFPVVEHQAAIQRPEENAGKKIL